ITSAGERDRLLTSLKERGARRLGLHLSPDAQGQLLVEEQMLEEHRCRAKAESASSTATVDEPGEPTPRKEAADSAEDRQRTHAAGVAARQRQALLRAQRGGGTAG
ncbi:MAG TPA: hypothetical protein VIK32_15500, partial [Candidatus Limnocylindrales bacterium]